jgi:DNA-binding NarL/FixJ family response regulator
MHPQEQYAIRAIKYGASGYLTKDSAAEELMLAVK